MTRRRVLHVIQNLNYGGMERLIHEMVRRTDRTRFEHHVLVLQYAGRFAEGLDGVAEVHVASPMSRWSMLSPSSLARDMRRIAPDVVQTHSGVWYKAMLAAALAGVPRRVHTEHGRQYPDPWLNRLVDRRASRRTDVVVAVSEAVRRQLVESVGVAPDRVAVILNGVDTARFCPRGTPGSLRARLGLAPDAPVIGSIGRLEPVKGYDVMIDAWAALRRDWSEEPLPVLVVAGDGSQRAALQEMAERVGVADGVRLLGWREDIEDLLALFDLFTMSSRSEGTSISLLEAMSAGACPVITDVGGNSAVLGPGLAHRLVPPARPDVLAQAWRAALLAPDRRLADGRAARARVVDVFSLERTVRAYEALYTDDTATT